MTTACAGHPPSHYVDGLPPDDPRRYEYGVCEVCGLLPEHQEHPRVASVWHSGYHKTHYHPVCGAECLERFHEAESAGDI
jgi:hypothetical protein